jgi:hypothetical protein
MRRILVATFILLAGTTATLAYCPSRKCVVAANRGPARAGRLPVAGARRPGAVAAAQVQIDAQLQQFQLELRTERNFANGLNALPQF